MSNWQVNCMRHQQAAVSFWEQGKHRESADEYWKAVQFLQPDHEMRYQLFHGYTSTLRGDYFEPSEDDINNMKKLLDNKHELRLFRMEAAYTLGVIYYSRSERVKAEDVYQRAISIGEKEPKKRQEKEEKKFMLFATAANPREEKKISDLMAMILKDCKKNRYAMNSHNAPEGETFTPSDMSVKRRHLMPMGPGGSSLTSDELNNLIDVGGIQCDYCKRREGPDVKLLKCSRCNRGFYCSKECQRKQWKENDHKSYCRKEGEFKPHDLVQLARLKNKPELNNHIVRVVGEDLRNEGRYKVQIEGGNDIDNPPFSVSGKNLNQMRPYDCRK